MDTNTRDFIREKNQQVEENNSKLLLADNEKIVKTYHCSRLDFPKCDGFLHVTNKRVIFSGYSTDGRIMNETKLDGITGISAFYGIKWLINQLIVGIVLVLISFYFITAKNDWSGQPDGLKVFFGLVMLVIGVYLAYLSKKNVFNLKIFASNSNAPISIGENYETLLGNSVKYSVVAAPTDQTDKMMQELGALIGDLQGFGDNAIAKWKE